MFKQAPNNGANRSPRPIITKNKYIIPTGMITKPVNGTVTKLAITPHGVII